VYAEQHWGKLALKQVMEPAIRLARDGFMLDYEEAQSFRDSHLAHFPSRIASSSATETTTRLRGLQAA